MHPRRPDLTWAYGVAAVVSLMMTSASRLAAQSSQPSDPERTSPPAEIITETTDLLEAAQSSRVSVVTRGQGQDRVRMTIRNTSGKRLNVVLPPGLVAVSAAGQGRPGQGGGGGFQSIGLGMVSNRAGSFGRFRDASTSDGLRSVSVEGVSRDPAITVPAGESVDLVIPGVCLNYGLPTPTPRDVFRLMDVDSYTTDRRIRKSLRSLCALGTSQGVAQAVMWRVCNDLSFEAMATGRGKVVNRAEIALAARFVEVLDRSTGRDLLDPDPFLDRRIFVRIQEDGMLAGLARRLNEELEGERLLGLPIHLTPAEELPDACTPVLSLRVALSTSREGEILGRISVSYAAVAGQWTPLGKAAFQHPSSSAELDGKSLALAIDRALAAAFVGVKPAGRSVGSTRLKLENHLPFTLASVRLRAGNSSGAPTVPFPGIGVGPARSTLLDIQAATAVIECVELNGL